MVRQRVRIRFCKQGDLRLIGHRDLMRCFERTFRRAELPLGFSEGFHPKPRMTFPSALALGTAGTNELMEFELREARSADDVARQMLPKLVPGLTVTSVEVLAEGTKKARLRSFTYEMPVPAEHRRGLAQRIDRLLEQPTCRVDRSGGRDPLDIRPMIEELALRGEVLLMRLRADLPATARPHDVLAVLGLGDLERQGVYLTRTRVEVQP